VGAVAVRILGGERADAIKVEPMRFATPEYDWRELQRWGISENRLPPGSVIDFRELTPWQKYSWQISATGAAILLEAALITVLLKEHRRRRLAEVQSQQHLADLVRANRFATAGELTASITHEINQPLGAAQINTDTLDLLLRSSSPDLHEMKEVVADIRNDQERIIEVVRRLRSLLKKAPLELRDIDLNDVARETEKFVSHFGRGTAREAHLSTFMATEPLIIRGDTIQLQQVLLNLIRNAIDAMSEIPMAERKVMIRTARSREFAEVSVSDIGPGIEPDKLKEVFEPFFTTKAQGMGMGLSIVRTIVEAHHGHIIAENQPSGGAIFRIRLPLVTLDSATNQQVNFESDLAT
jgi:C4-dicarboxylate-specific signal transduction histidine kinase